VGRRMGVDLMVIRQNYLKCQESHYPRLVSIQRLEGRKQLGGPRHRGEDNIKMDIQEV
jgi:hypothetical protein